MATANQGYFQGYNEEFIDPEAQDGAPDNKYAREIRHGFIRKVYGIIATQLMISTTIAAYFTFDTVGRTWMLQNMWLPLVLGITAMVLVCVLVCVPNVAQRVPTNYILLFTFTLCESFFVAGACAAATKTSGGTIVFQAALATCIITLGLTVFSFQTKYDFTSYTAMLFYVTLAASIFALFTLFFRSELVVGIVSAIFALIMCAHIVVDTQYLLGSGKIKASEDDYVLCAMMLYLDIINLFLYLLRLLQLLNRSN